MMEETRLLLQTRGAHLGADGVKLVHILLNFMSKLCGRMNSELIRDAYVFVDC